MSQKKSKVLSFKYLIYDLIRISALPGLLWFRPKKIYVSEKVKQKSKGGTLYISNHITLFDPMYMMILIPYRRIHFIAMSQLFEGKFRHFADRYKNRHKGMVYCLTNFNSSMEENLHRIYVLRDLNFDPFVMVYNKPSAPQEIINLQRWCNNKFVFKKVKRFEDYLGSRHYRQILTPN